MQRYLNRIDECKELVEQTLDQIMKNLESCKETRQHQFNDSVQEVKLKLSEEQPYLQVGTHLTCAKA